MSSDRPSTVRASSAGAPPAGALPAPQEIVPPSSANGGLYRLRTPMTSTALPWIMPYAFLGADGVTLFDSGYGTTEATEAMTQQLAALGRTPADIQRLVVSHLHPDHIGMAGWIKRQSPDAQLVMYRLEGEAYGEMHHGHDRWEHVMRDWGVRHGFDANAVEEDERPPWAPSAPSKSGAATEGKTSDAAAETERRSWSMERVTPDVLLEDGEELDFDGFTLRAVWTPGHTDGHLCVYEPNHRLTFTGDHVLSRITPNVSLSPEDDEAGRNPLAEYTASLQKTAALDTALCLPAHEELIEDLPGRCRVILEHHEHREEEVMAGIGQANEGGATALEVASRVTWNRPWETFSVFKRRAAMGETLAHLRFLEVEGRVRRVADDAGLVRWFRTA